MTPRLPSCDTSELALRALERTLPNEWLVLETPADRSRTLGDELAADIAAISNVEATRSDVNSASALIEALQRPGNEIRVITGLDALSTSDWSHLDLARSRLTRDGCVVLVASAASIAMLYRHAPNLASWIAAAVLSFDDSGWILSDDEREQRLDALREWSGIDDVTVIARAERGTLPRDPEYAEWLVLLGRDDLVPQQPPTGDL